MEIFLSNALATSTGTFPPHLLGAAWPDATAALCQTKHFEGVGGSDGNTPQPLPCSHEEVKPRAKNSRHDWQARNSRRLPSLQHGGFPSVSQTHLCSTGTSEFAASAYGVLTRLWSPPADPLHLPEIVSTGRSLWIVEGLSHDHNPLQVRPVAFMNRNTAALQQPGNRGVDPPKVPPTAPSTAATSNTAQGTGK